jgi:hypothetical protein
VLQRAQHFAFVLFMLRGHLQWPKVINAPLAEVDPELYDIIEHEKNRQYKVCACPQQ